MKNIITMIFMASFFLISCNQKSATSSEIQEEITYKTIPQSTFDSLAKLPNVIVVDVRTPTEIQQGKISSADLFIDYNNANFKQEISKLDTSKTYLLYCKSGVRSSSAAEDFIEKGFTKVYDLESGISNYKP